MDDENVIRLEVVGNDALIKLIDALTSKQNMYSITVTTDDYGSFCLSENRAYIVYVNLNHE